MSTAVLVAPDNVQLTAASLLQTLLSKLVVVELEAKQVHWNVTGPAFIAVHSLSDELADDLRAWADRVAERAVALGSPVDVRPDFVASAVPRRLPAGWLSDRQALAELARGIDDIAAFVRESGCELERHDTVARQVADEIREGLEKYGWMLRAQIR